MTSETEAAIREWISTAEGWCVIEKALELAQFIIDEKPKNLVSIGIFAGGSFIPQALALKENGAGKIWGIDPWSTSAAIEQVFSDGSISPADEEVARKWWETVDLERMMRLCMEGVWRYGLQERAIVIRATSQDCYELFNEISLLEIDGNHSEVASCRDVELYLPRLKSGGLLLFDDAHWASTQKAVAMLDAACTVERDHESYKIYRKP